MIFQGLSLRCQSDRERIGERDYYLRQSPVISPVTPARAFHRPGFTIAIRRRSQSSLPVPVKTSLKQYLFSKISKSGTNTATFFRLIKRALCKTGPPTPVCYNSGTCYSDILASSPCIDVICLNRVRNSQVEMRKCFEGTAARS